MKRSEIENLPLLDWLTLHVAELRADQAARPVQWQDEWYKRETQCRKTDALNQLTCYEPKYHEGPHTQTTHWTVYTWEDAPYE